jgi:hypothetical protein
MVVMKHELLVQLGIAPTDEDLEIWCGIVQRFALDHCFEHTHLWGNYRQADKRDAELMRRLTSTGDYVTEHCGNPDGTAVVHALLRTGIEVCLP